MNNWRKDLWAASKVYCPDFPRQASDDTTPQAARINRADLVAGLEAASRGSNPGYYSVYSFPYGSTKDDVVPKVDCLFIDFDITKEYYDPKQGKTDFEAWRRDMTALLTRVRMVAKAILEDGSEAHWRFVLSGHKGIHLYLDFGAIAPNEGDFYQFKNGLRAYGEEVVRWLNQEAGGVDILPWVDVDGSDLARLARHPNTRHHGAVYDDVDRWAVPVTVEELAELTVEDYLDLTAAPRAMTPEMGRVPSGKAHDDVVQKIRGASSTRSRGSYRDDRESGPTYNGRTIEDYDETANHDIELEDLLDPLLMGNKPCILAFRDRDDAYQHGIQSRKMEISIMSGFIQMGVPTDVIHEFFEPIPGYDEEYTNDMLADLIGRGESGYKEFDCATIAGGLNKNGQPLPGEAPEFCLGESCGIYRRSDDVFFRAMNGPTTNR